MKPLTLLKVALLVLAFSVQAKAQTAPTVAGPTQPSEVDGEFIIAPTAPPALPKVSDRPPVPFDGAVWTSPYWFWEGRTWALVEGTWIAPLSGYQYVNAYWKRVPRGWLFVSGGWAQPGHTEVEIPVTPAGESLIVDQAPPPAKMETRTLAPSVTHAWVPGYWYWSGQGWIWIGGTWIIPPHSGVVWVGPHWVQRGTIWVFVGGGWAPRGHTHVVIPVHRHGHVVVSPRHPHRHLHVIQGGPAGPKIIHPKKKKPSKKRPTLQKRKKKRPAVKSKKRRK
jgi:hypothetical protein